jgi:hypothetical protein
MQKVSLVQEAPAQAKSLLNFAEFLRSHFREWVREQNSVRNDKFWRAGAEFWHFFSVTSLLEAGGQVCRGQDQRKVMCGQQYCTRLHFGALISPQQMHLRHRILLSSNSHASLQLLLSDRELIVFFSQECKASVGSIGTSTIRCS